MLEAGAKVDETDNDGKGALMLAAQEGHSALVERLLEQHGAPIDQHAHDGKTALRYDQKYKIEFVEYSTSSKTEFDNSLFVSFID